MYTTFLFFIITIIAQSNIARSNTAQSNTAQPNIAQSKTWKLENKSSNFLFLLCAAHTIFCAA